MAEPLQLGKRPSPTGGKLRLLTLRQATGSPDQMRQAGWPGLNPPLIDAIPMLTNKPRPLLNERGKGFLWSGADGSYRRRPVHWPSPRATPAC